MRRFYENYKTECTHSLVLSLPCRNKNSAIVLENWIKSAIKHSMKVLHFSNSFISLKPSCKGYWDSPLIWKLTKKVFVKTVGRIIVSKNSLLGMLLMDYTSPIDRSHSVTIVWAINVSNCSTRASINSMQTETYWLYADSETVTNTQKSNLALT